MFCFEQNARRAVMCSKSEAIRARPTAEEKIFVEISDIIDESDSDYDTDAVYMWSLENGWKNAEARNNRFEFF